MNIAFCINRFALIGVGVTISSLIRNCSDSGKLSIWFLGSDLIEKDKENICQLLAAEKFNGKHHIIDFNPKEEFGMFHSLYHDWTTYGRLLLPEIVNEERVLYLDADLAVELDVLDANYFDLDGYAIGAVYGNKLKYALDGAFIIKEIGLSPETDYFNAGILLMDLQMWRSKKLKEKCLNIARKYPKGIRSNDQTLLNIIFGNNYARLPKKFNCPWLEYNQKPDIAEKMIIHYVGSPKPSDIGGKTIHAGFKTWKKYLHRDWAKSYYGLTSKNIARAWKIRRSYIRLLKNKFIQ